MRRITGMVIAVVTAFALSSPASAQVISLLVGNQSNFNGIDAYAITNGSYQGVFAGPGNGPPNYAFLTYGPDNNLYVSSNIGTNPVSRFNGMTGNPLGTFVNAPGGNFTFGTAGDFFRIDQNGNNVLRYNGSTGQLVGTFSAGLTGAGVIHFGLGGDLFVDSLNSIKRFNGQTGAFIGDFVTTGSGGLTAVDDFLFTSDNRLLVSGGSGGVNDKILQYNGTTGAFVGVFAQGNGLNLPHGMALGPDGNLYVASQNSILEFNLSSGTFLGQFVPTTAHGTALDIAFSPFPIPEPSSLVLCAWVAMTTSAIRFRRWRAHTTPR